jgi:hypothetical protein
VALGFPVELGALGTALGIGAAIVSTGGDTRKIAQVGGMTAAGIGLGMALDPDGDSAETVAGTVIAVVGVLGAIFIGNKQS